jgi:hypothetical protein
MPKLTFRTISGFHFRHRGIGFLEGDTWLNAGQGFSALEGNDEFNVRGRIGHWLRGEVCDNYHHGFPNDKKHKECYVFRYQSVRFYGFLCNPQLESNRGFRLCVLTECVEKHQWKTEPAILDRAMRMLADLGCMEAIAKTYPEYGKGATPWKN